MNSLEALFALAVKSPPSEMPAPLAYSARSKSRASWPLPVTLYTRSSSSRASLREPRLAQLAESWEKIARYAREVEIFNLDRRPFVLGTLSELSGLARR